MSRLVKFLVESVLESIHQRLGIRCALELQANLGGQHTIRPEHPRQITTQVEHDLIAFDATSDPIFDQFNHESPLTSIWYCSD